MRPDCHKKKKKTQMFNVYFEHLTTLGCSGLSVVAESDFFLLDTLDFKAIGDNKNLEHSHRQSQTDKDCCYCNVKEILLVCNISQHLVNP